MAHFYYSGGEVKESPFHLEKSFRWLQLFLIVPVPVVCVNYITSFAGSGLWIREMWNQQWDQRLMHSTQDTTLLVRTIVCDWWIHLTSELVYYTVYYPNPLWKYLLHCYLNGVELTETSIRHSQCYGATVRYETDDCRLWFPDFIISGLPNDSRTGMLLIGMCLNEN